MLQWSSLLQWFLSSACPLAVSVGYYVSLEAGPRRFRVIEYVVAR
jgi:hypothetical protein